jgi:hypothetical protein
LFSEREVLLTRRTLVHFLLSLTFLSTHNNCFWLFSLFLVVPLFYDMGVGAESSPDTN